MGGTAPSKQHSYEKCPFSSMMYLFRTMIFHSYVSVLEGQLMNDLERLR